MAICNNCHQELPDLKISFCPHCGAKIDEISQSLSPKNYLAPDEQPFEQTGSDEAEQVLELIPADETPSEEQHPGIAAPVPDTDESSSENTPVSGDERDWIKNGVIDLDRVPTPEESEEVLKEDVRSGPAWENPQEKGRLGGLFTTITTLLFSPVTFFETMRVRGDYFWPLLFAMIVGTSGAIVNFGWSQLLGTVNPFSGSGLQHSATFEQMSVIFSIGLLIASPILILINLFISGLIIHFVLYIFGGARQGFEATYRVIAYTTGTSVLYLIPIVGAYIVVIYSIVLEIIGLKEAHEIDGWKALLAVIIPIIVCCCGFALFFAVLFGLASEELMQQMRPNF